MTSATDVLRRLLDERGVEWDKGAFPHEERTYWREMVSVPWDEQRIHVMALLTPEQAIAATLGGRTCRVEKAMSGAYEQWSCSECGEMLANWSMRYCPNCGAKVVSE